MKKFLISLAAILALLLAVVAAQPSDFRYESSIEIDALPSEIFPYIGKLKMAEKWSPYEKIDPDMQKTFTGEDGAPGAKMEFVGNSEVGSGSIEILKVRPYQFVDLRLTMTKPMYSTSHVQYRLEKVGEKTRFIWSMAGKNSFLFKLIGLFVDVEEMVESQFKEGQSVLKKLVEEKKEVESEGPEPLE